MKVHVQVYGPASGDSALGGDTDSANLPATAEHWLGLGYTLRIVPAKHEPEDPMDEAEAEAREGLYTAMEMLS